MKKKIILSAFILLSTHMNYNSDFLKGVLLPGMAAVGAFLFVSKGFEVTDGWKNAKNELVKKEQTLKQELENLKGFINHEGVSDNLKQEFLDKYPRAREL